MLRREPSKQRLREMVTESCYVAELVTCDRPTISARRIAELVNGEFRTRPTGLAYARESPNLARIRILRLQLLLCRLSGENLSPLLLFIQLPQIGGRNLSRHGWTHTVTARLKSYSVPSPRLN